MRIVKCPICNIDMKTIMVKEVEIDKCPKCEGVWLDKGELDDLAEKESKTTKSESSDFVSTLALLRKTDWTYSTK